jgi:hypothetical protein
MALHIVIKVLIKKKDSVYYKQVGIMKCWVCDNEYRIKMRDKKEIILKDYEFTVISRTALVSSQ